MVVHAAATAGRARTSTVAELDLTVLDEVYRTNIRGTFQVAQQAARRLRDGGAIVTFSSSVVPLAFPGYGAYSASKGAVEALTLILARELAGRDITVNAVAPGPVATPMTERNHPPARRAAILEQTPLGRYGRPEDIIGAVLFLASDAAGFITGQTLSVDGGLSIRGLQVRNN